MSKTSFVPFTPVLDTSQYADGDLLFDCTEVASFFEEAGGARALHSLLIVDEDDQGAALDILFVNAAEDFGTANSAYAISDAEARSIVGRIQVETGDWFDWGGFRTAIFNNVGQVLGAAGGSTSLWVAGISRGTPTYTASGLKFRIGSL